MASKGPQIAIVGGGISGVTLAIALIRRGVDVHVYEQAAKFGEHIRNADDHS
jgi:salicylate hydroxylase